MRTENEGYLHLYDGFYSRYKHFPQTTEWAEKISLNKLYTRSASTTAAHLLHGLRWQETQKTESCQLLKVYGLSIKIQCYVIMTSAHVQAAGYKRTTIIMLLYWNRVKNIFYPQNLTPPENTTAIRIGVVLQTLYVIKLYSFTDNCYYF